MKKNKYLCISVILLIWTANLFAQSQRNVRNKILINSSNSSKSSPTNIYLPSNAENYISLRLASLGDGLKGIVSDGISDYFRNPAYVNMIETRAYYLDIDRQGSSNDLRFSMFSSLFNGRFGLSFSGDATKTISTDNRTDPELDLFDDTIYSTSNTRNLSNNNYNLHLWWANKFSENLKYGFNYIRKISDVDNIKSNTRARRINRINEFTQSTSIDNQIDSRINENRNEVNVNTFRAGLIFGSSPDMVIDLVFKAEFTDFSVDVLTDRINSRDNLFTSPSYTQQWERIDTTTNVFGSDGSSNVYGFKMNIKNKLNDSVVQSFLISFDKISFDVSNNKTQKYSKVYYQKRDSIFSNSKIFTSSELKSDRNDATGYVFGLGFGREITIESAIIGIGINAEITNGRWDDNIIGSSTGFTEDSNNDTTFKLNLSADSTETATTDVSTKLIFFPIGGEFYVSKKVSIRMGVEFDVLLAKSKISLSSGKILSQLERNSRWNTKRFGIGYKHSDKFFADLMVSSDLAQISTWRVSIQYGL